ncbi:diacylglycerol O-acyltransferase 1 [Cystobasidiomycetes sp. EMM_F5]
MSQLESEKAAAARAVKALETQLANSDLTNSNQASAASRIQFVPLSVPPNRRLQTAVVIRIDSAPAKGARPIQTFRKLGIWKLFAGYFPIRLEKTVDLPADRRYVFGYHPHGIIGVGAIANFGTEATGFSDLFPGIQPRLMTLTTNFRIPIYRELFTLLDPGKAISLSTGPGSSITIVVGGAAESLSAHPGTADLVLKRRLGFIKLAIKEGADLVPVFSFGENDIFEQLANPKGTKLYTLQKRFQSLFGFTLPIIHGRGILNYTIGFLPYRHPIVSVVGRPIRVERSDSPTLEYMQSVQSKYIAELTRIWDEHKDAYATNRFDAANAPNNEDIEKQFAVKCMEHAETYWKLITALPPSKLRLTKHDDELVSSFLADFPEFNDNEKLARITDDEIKSPAMKDRWRTFFKKWEKTMDNFGTLMRSDCKLEYSCRGQLDVW